MRAALIAALVVFVILEGALARWAFQTLTLDTALATFNHPLTLMMLVDFTFVATLVFFWIVSDARRRGQNGWLYLPGMILAPTVALIVYLLVRRPLPT